MGIEQKKKKKQRKKNRKTKTKQKKKQIFFTGNSPKSLFLVGRVKKTWEFPKFFMVFWYKNGNSQFFTILVTEKWEFPFYNFLEFPFLRIKFKPGNPQIFN